MPIIIFNVSSWQTRQRMSQVIVLSEKNTLLSVSYLNAQRGVQVQISFCAILELEGTMIELSQVEPEDIRISLRNRLQDDQLQLKQLIEAALFAIRGYRQSSFINCCWAKVKLFIPG